MKPQKQPDWAPIGSMKRLRLQAGSNEYDTTCIICGGELEESEFYWCEFSFQNGDWPDACDAITQIPIPTECLNLPVEDDWSAKILEIT